MSGVDLVGYVAAGLVLVTFCMRDMVALRCTAVASNLAFISYGLLSGMGPVLALHLLLLPINVMHLLASARQQAPTRSRTAVPGESDALVRGESDAIARGEVDAIARGDTTAIARGDVTGHRTRDNPNRNPEQAHHD